MGPLLRRYLLGDRGTIAGTVYGTIVVLSVIAAGAKAYEHQLWRLASIANTEAPQAGGKIRSCSALRTKVGMPRS